MKFQQKMDQNKTIEPMKRKDLKNFSSEKSAFIDKNRISI
jgi:hypothetical protein